MGASISFVFFGGQELHHHTPDGTCTGCSVFIVSSSTMGHVLLWSGISFAVETPLFVSRIMVNFLKTPICKHDILALSFCRIYRSTTDLESQYSSWSSSQKAAWPEHLLFQKVKELVTNVMETEINTTHRGLSRTLLCLGRSPEAACAAAVGSLQSCFPC